jgi:hypothetical protein
MSCIFASTFDPGANLNVFRSPKARPIQWCIDKSDNFLPEIYSRAGSALRSPGQKSYSAAKLRE